MALSKITNGGVAASGLPTTTVLQVLQVSQAGAQTISAAETFTNITGLSLDITPIATTSKILVQWSVNFYMSSGYGITIVPIRDDTTRFYYNNTARPYEQYVGAGGFHGRNSNQFLDSPATTSTINYKIQWAVSNTSSSVVSTDSFPMTLTLMEIAG